MIPVLPEILFYEGEHTEVEVTLRPQFDLVFVKQYEKTFKVRYTVRFYQEVTKLFLSLFKDGFNELIKLLFPKSPASSPFYIIDDTEEEGISEEETENEEAHDFLSQLFGKLKDKVVSWIKDIFKKFFKKIWDKFLDGIKKLVRKWLKRFKRFVLKLWARVKRFFRRVWNWLKRFISKILKRLWRLVKRFFWKMVGRFKRVVLKALRKVKRFGPRILKFMVKHSKFLLKLLKPLFKKAIKIVIRLVVNLIAAAFDATGIGAPIGIILTVAMAAWDAYDIYTMGKEMQEAQTSAENEAWSDSGLADTPEEANFDDGGLAAVGTFDDTNLSLPGQDNEGDELSVEERGQENLEIHKDDVSITLNNQGDYPHQILSRLYITYKITNKWLMNMQEFVINTFNEFVSKFNDFGNRVQDLTEHMMDNYEEIPEYKKLMAKDPQEVKPFPHYSDTFFKGAAHYICNKLKVKDLPHTEQPELSSWDKRILEGLFKTKHIVRENTYSLWKGLALRKAQKRYTRIRIMLKFGIRVPWFLWAPEGFSPKRFDAEDVFEDYLDIKDYKIKALKIKNALLYYLWNIVELTREAKTA